MYAREVCFTCPPPALIIPAPLLFKDGLDSAILQGKIPRGPPTLARPAGCVVGELEFPSLTCCRMLGYPTQCCDLLKPQFAFLGMRSLGQSLICQLSCSVPVRVPGEPIEQRIKQRSL